MRRCYFALFLLVLCLCAALPSAAQTHEIASGIVLFDRGIDPLTEVEGIVPFNEDRRLWADETGNLLSRLPGDHEGSTAYALPTYLLEDTDFACVDLRRPVDMSDHEILRLVCRAVVDGRPVGERQLTVTLYAGESAIAYTTPLPPNDWCYVDLDIGSWDDRSGLRRIELSFNGEANLQFAYLRTDAPMNHILRERFLTDSFTGRGCKLYFATEARSGYLVATENSPMITATTLVPEAAVDTNALRLVFENGTDCRSITLQYAYSPDGANARSVTQSIGEGRQICVFEVPDARRVRYIRFIFSGAREGLITLNALNAVSIYEIDIAHLGTVTDCSVTADGREIVVRGTVAHDVMISNRAHCLALFALSPWDSINEALTDGREPDARADISIRFAFSLPFAVQDYAALGAQYLVAIDAVDADGNHTYTPIADPRSLSVAYIPPTVSGSGAIKGVQTDLVSTAGQTGASIYLLDVYLDRLCSGNASGYRPVGMPELYFDRDLLDALDEAVRLRSVAGEQVYLRLLISQDGLPLEYAMEDIDLGHNATRGILLRDARAEEMIGAITAFLCDRYNGEDEAGKIAGLIVGRQVDDANLHNNIGLRTLADYVDCYADLLTLIANTARRIDPTMQVIVPISDRRPAECITADQLILDYDSELFLRALFKRLEDHGGPALSLMLESEHNPFSLLDGVLDESDESEEAEEDLPLTATELYYNADDLRDFSALLDTMSATYAVMPSTFLYCWTPDADTGDALSAAYAYLYYRLRFSTHADAFIVSFADAEASGDMSGMTALKYLMKYIDTDRSLEVSESALAVFGVRDWSELIEGFDESRLAGRRWLEGELTVPTGSASGRHTYFDFRNAHSTRGWYTGAYVSGLGVKGSGEDRGLVATLTSGRGEVGAYSELVYRFSPGEPLALLDRVAFTLEIVGEGAWEVCIMAGASTGDQRLEQKQVVRAGERITLCLDTSGMDDALTDFLKLCVKPVSGAIEGKLCLYTVEGESDSLDNNALDARLRELRRLDPDIPAAKSKESDLVWLFIACAVTIFSIAIAVILGRRQEEELREKP